MLPKRRKPNHPGVILSEDFLKPLGWTVQKFAAVLGPGWNEKKIQAIIEGEEPITDEAAEALPLCWRPHLNFGQGCSSNSTVLKKSIDRTKRDR